MSINLTVPATTELKPRLIVFGVGGGGGNAVNNMIGAALTGVEFVVANTDAQDLNTSLCDRRIQLGAVATSGLGAGMKPEIGRLAAEEAMDQIAEYLQGCHMAFIAAGMGGGTGTGAAPVVARVAKEMGILTVGVVTKPFSFEGTSRMRLADAGIRELQQYVDSLIVIPNQNLFRVVTEKTTYSEAFKMADNVLYSGVRGITDLIVNPGIMNLDFADVRSAMSQMGKAMMGTGEAEGERRAIEAAERAIANPLLDEVSMKGARGLIINITGGADLTLFEVDEAAERVRKEVDPEADIYVGTALDEKMDGRIRVSVVATGIDREAVAAQNAPAPTEKVVPMTRPIMRPAPAPQPAAQPMMSTGAHRLDAMPAASLAPVAVSTQQQPAAAQMPQSFGATALAVQPQPELPMPAVQVPLPMSAPVAEARPQSAEAPFQAPPAMPVPARRPLIALPDPIAEADQVNAGHAPEERARKKSLIERIASYSRTTTPAAPAERIEPVASRAPAAPAPTMASPAPAPMPAPAPTLSAAAKPASLLPALDAAERPAPAAASDDLLDIPAFLRRQAN